MHRRHHDKAQQPSDRDRDPQPPTPPGENAEDDEHAGQRQPERGTDTHREPDTQTAEKTAIVLLSAAGKLFRQETGRRFAALERVILICGRYEGVDERVAEHLATDEISIGDFVVWTSLGTPAYQLAVVVDDADQGVTTVVRGDDLIPSTPRQLMLYRALGLMPPEFVHVPLVVGPDGRRLAKRHGDTRLKALREAGVRAEQVVGLLAWSCGWLPEPTPRSTCGMPRRSGSTRTRTRSRRR